MFRRYRDRLWAVAVRTLHDPDDAADALQEAMISAFRRAADFRGDAAVTTWLHRIVVNACVDQLRRRATRPAVQSDDEAALDALHRRTGGPATDPMSASDTALDVDAALQVLPDEQRAALVLVDMLGYSISAAADILGVSAGTVKSRCSRGRARLLPHVAHLRGSKPSPEPTAGPPADAQRNQMAAADVSSPQAAAPTTAVASPAGHVRPGYSATPADQRAVEGGGSADRDQAS